MIPKSDRLLDMTRTVTLQPGDVHQPMAQLHGVGVEKRQRHCQLLAQLLVDLTLGAWAAEGVEAFSKSGEAKGAKTEYRSEHRQAQGLPPGRRR